MERNGDGAQGRNRTTDTRVSPPHFPSQGILAEFRFDYSHLHKRQKAGGFLKPEHGLLF
jgi:hypothetical protein